MQIKVKTHCTAMDHTTQHPRPYTTNYIPTIYRLLSATKYGAYLSVQQTKNSYNIGSIHLTQVQYRLTTSKTGTIQAPNANFSTQHKLLQMMRGGRVISREATSHQRQPLNIGPQPTQYQNHGCIMHLIDCAFTLDQSSNQSHFQGATLVTNARP